MKKNHDPMVRGKTRMTISKFTEKMRDFDRECEHLLQLVPLAFSLYRWNGAKSDEERVCTLQYLGQLLYQAFHAIKAVFETRTQLIRDEHCDCFEELLLQEDDDVQAIEDFVEEAEEALQHALNERPQLLDFGKMRLIANFKDAAVWMSELSKDEDLLNHTAEKCKSLNLHFGVRSFGMPAEGFRQQTYDVLACLALLAVPSHAKATTAEFAQLYRNSFDTFRQSTYCKEDLEVYDSRVDDLFKAKNIRTNAQKIDELIRMQGTEKEDIRTFLSQYGICYTDSSTDASAGKLGRRLYRSLNADADIDVPKMSNDDLCRYFLKEAHLAYLSATIDKLGKEVDDPTPGADFFKEGVNRSVLRQALYQTVYKEQAMAKGNTNSKRYVLGAQAHWLAILRVMESKDMVRGNMKRFAELMNLWFPTAPHPCDYRSMISARADDVRLKAYPDWDMSDKANFPFRRVAEVFEKDLQKYNII